MTFETGKSTVQIAGKRSFLKRNETSLHGSKHTLVGHANKALESPRKKAPIRRVFNTALRGFDDGAMLIEVVEVFFMAETAVGMFQHPGTADAVLEELRVNGIPSSGIRSITMPLGMTTDSVTAMPGVDFAAGLSKDLTAMGASAEEAEWYVAGVQRGNVLIFASGTPEEADAAAAVMEEFEPIALEEFAGVVPASHAAVHAGNVTAQAISIKEDRSRAKADGARVFSW
jgi:hypothetical protein